MISLFAAVLLLLSAATATNFTKCSSGTPPIALAISGCEQQPCSFKTGDQVTLDITFEVDHTVTKLVPDVKVVAFNITTDYPLPQPDGCKALVGASCPVEDGETVKYDLKMNVPPIHLKSDVDVTFTMVDQDKKTLMCFELKVKVA